MPSKSRKLILMLLGATAVFAIPIGMAMWLKPVSPQTRDAGAEHRRQQLEKNYRENIRPHLPQ